MIVTMAAQAQVEFVKDGLKYTTLDATSVKVGKIDDKHCPKGKVRIPERVKHDGVTYTVTAIGSWGFFGCEDITELKLPSTLKKIDIWALCRCKNLKEIKIPAGVTEIGYSAFENCEAITSLTLPDGITAVPERMAQECKNLRQVNLPAGITVIRGSAFSDCDALERIVLPRGVRAIGSYAFSSCEKLAFVTLPQGLETIEHEAFNSCPSLVEIDLPEGLIELGQRAFNYCRSLERVTLPASLTTINGNPFASCNALKEYRVAPGNKSFAVVDGILFTHDLTELLACPVKKELGDYVVPPGVVNISSFAFYDCKSLTGLKMTSVKTIGESAFSGCSRLAKVDFGDKLESLAKGAFYSNGSLTEVSLPSSFRHMEQCNFDFSGLKTVYLDEKLLEDERDFNNLSFQFCGKDLIFIVRLAKGGTRTLTIDGIPDMKKYFRNR